MSDVFPGSISDSTLTEKSEVLNWVGPEHGLMSDRRFAVQEYCDINGVFLNHPDQKSSNQFEGADETLILTHAEFTMRGLLVVLEIGEF